MILAHGPSGYLLARVTGVRELSFGAAIVGAYAPDFDALYFTMFGPALADHRYWSPLHWPVFWAALAGPLLIWARMRGRRTFAAAGLFLAGVLLHLCLDTVTWYVYWGAPFSMDGFRLTDPTSVARPWPWNFLTHWTMALELAICAAALAMRLLENGRILPRRPQLRAGAAA